MRFKVATQGAPGSRTFCDWYSVIELNSGASETASGIWVVRRSRRQYASQLSRCCPEYAREP